jgi:transcriptional regulator with XRE-family HTH domain
MLMIGERLRKIRKSKKLSQGDIEERTGMLRCYTSRVENGHTVPALRKAAWKRRRRPKMTFLHI